jgi:hypothetical protein
MAQTGYSVLSIYNSSTASAAPTAGNLVAGELAINTADGKLFYKDSSGVVQTMASKATGTVAGATTQVIYNNAGAYAGSANFTFDGTNVTFGSSSGAAIRWQNGYQTITGDAGTDVLTYRTYSTHVWKTLTSAGSNTDGTERMRVNGNGIGLGAAVPSSGVGITFPATQSASSNANTLDDYEEGTWTPTDGSGAGLSLSTNANANYTKIGNLVTVTAFIIYPTTSNTANAILDGLPFLSSNTGYAAGGLFNNSGVNLTTFINANTTQLNYRTNTNSNVTNASMSGKFISFSISYQI